MYNLPHVFYDHNLPFILFFDVLEPLLIQHYINCEYFFYIIFAVLIQWWTANRVNVSYWGYVISFTLSVPPNNQRIFNLLLKAACIIKNLKFDITLTRCILNVARTGRLNLQRFTAFVYLKFEIIFMAMVLIDSVSQNVFVLVRTVA